MERTRIITTYLNGDKEEFRLEGGPEAWADSLGAAFSRRATFAVDSKQRVESTGNLLISMAQVRKVELFRTDGPTWAAQAD